MRYFQILVIVALAVSLVMNYSLFSRIDQLEMNMHNLSHDQRQMMSSIDGQSYHIESVMNDIREEQSWISSISIDVDANDSASGQVFLTFEWQIKELPNNNPEVVFNYTLGNNENYETVPAEEVQNGLFRVKVPFELDLEPQWYVSRSYSHGSESTAVEEVTEYPYKENELKYFVSMSDGGMMKSSSQHATNLEHYSKSVFGPIYANIHTFNKEVTVDVSGENYHGSTQLEKVYLLKYQAGQLVEEQQMATNKWEDWHYHFWLEQPLEEGSFDRLVIRAVFNNGKTFEKEVYQN